MNLSAGTMDISSGMLEKHLTKRDDCVPLVDWREKKIIRYIFFFSFYEPFTAQSVLNGTINIFRVFSKIIQLNFMVLSLKLKPKNRKIKTYMNLKKKEISSENVLKFVCKSLH